VPAPSLSKGALARIAQGIGWAVLGALAAAGLALAALTAYAGLSPSGSVVSSLVTREVGALLAGRLTIQGLALLSRGGIEVRGLELRDPDGHVVLAAPRARVFADVTGLARGWLGLVVEVDSPSVLLATEADGGLSIARAFASPRPAREGAAAPSARGGKGLAVEVRRLTARDGTFRWLQRDGSTALAAAGLDLDASGSWRGEGGRLEVQVRGAAEAPVGGPLSISGAASLRGDRLEVPVLDVALGGTSLQALGEVDLGRGAFRAAARRLGLAAEDARRLVPPRAAPGGDVAGAAYVESDGTILGAALELAPSEADGEGGRASIAAALRTGAPRTVGLDVALAAFDPSRFLAQAPAGRIELTARGAVAEADRRARITLALGPSHLRGTELGPATLTARAARGAVEVDRLEARVPGVAVTGRGTWRARGAVGGEAEVDARDLAAGRRALEALSGVSLPPIAGRLRAHATLTGTADAPGLGATVDAPHLGVGGARLEGVSLTLDGAGPVATGRLRVSGRAARAVAGGTEARGIELSARVAGEEASFSLGGSVPSVGPDPVAIEGRARLAEGRERAEVRALAVRWPGARFALVRPAAVAFAPPAVDRLELADGPRSIAVSGGAGRDGALDVRVELVRLDLATLPRGLVPPEAGLQGELTADARATGSVDAPVLAAHLQVANGAILGAGGLQLSGDLGWRAGRRAAASGTGRLTAALRLQRTEGGAAELAADLPLPLLRAAPGEEVSLTVDATAFPLDVVRRLAGATAQAPGSVRGRVAVGGTAAAPRLEATLAVEGAALADLRPLAVEAALRQEDGSLHVTASSRLADAPLVSLDAKVPLALAPLLRDPGSALRALWRAPLAGTLEIPRLDLARVAGKAGIPAGLAGTLSGEASLTGTASAPRGRARLSVAEGAFSGYRDVEASADVTLEADRVALSLRASLGGGEEVRVEGSLGAPVERLGDAAALRAAPLALEVTVPSLSLARTPGVTLPLEGTISAHLDAKGSLSRPQARLELDGKQIALGGRPVGDLAVRVRHEVPTSRADLSLRSAAGGTLRAEATLEAPRGLAEPGRLREATAAVRVTSDQLELGFLPAFLPAIFRAAAGRLTVALSASGPVSDLRAEGKLALEGGRLDVVEIGDWSGIELAAELAGDRLRITQLEAQRRGGRLSGRLEARDLWTATRRFEGRLELAQLPISYAGSEVATLDLPVELEGTISRRLLDAKVTVESGTVRLPRKASGSLQDVGERPDIIEADLVAERARRRARTAPTYEGEGTEPPFEVRCRVVAKKLGVRAERPAVNVELETDSTWRVAGEAIEASGTIETVRGTVEPLSARVFHLERAKVTFPGGPVGEGVLDVVARYDNPVAVVTVRIGGTIAKPARPQYSSQPTLDEEKIQMLIITGRTEMNLNTSSVAPLTAQEASAAVVGAAMSSVFSGLVSDRLPVDQISFDTTRLYAGKYVTDSLFVGYVYRFEAKAEEGENVNEVRAEYRLARSWRFELRYGDANVGDASIIWTKDY
jgi:translocation and assembly module TamB